jgi:hypothetical protein
MDKRWFQSNTVRVAIAGMLTAVAGYLTGTIGTPDLIQAVMLGLIAIFLRKGTGTLTK